MSAFREFAGLLSASVPEAEGKQFAVAFVSDTRMRELNRLFRDKDATTDVLSFPFEAEEFEVAAISPPDEAGAEFADDNQNRGFIGDIVISTEQAARQAQENGLSLENEIKQLMLHGLLHLCGYDHETDTGEMDAREVRLRKKLSI